MSGRYATFLSLLAAGLLLAGCNRDTPAEQAAEQPAPAPAAPAQTAVAPSTELTVKTVESVMVTRPQDAPDTVVIQVSGTVPSVGWTDPKLVPVESTDPTVRSFNFVATSPADAAAGAAAEPVQARLQLDTLPEDVTAIRIVSATNAVQAFLSSP
jgi:hypothetical protein